VKTSIYEKEHKLRFNKAKKHDKDVCSDEIMKTFSIHDYTPFIETPREEGQQGL